MAARFRQLIPAIIAAASRGVASSVSACRQPVAQVFGPSAWAVLSKLGAASPLQRSLHGSAASQQESAPAAAADGPVKLYEPSRKFRPLADKELWHEAWMYEDRFGSVEDPIVVPSLEDERIIGVTDPEDDNLVVWGILKANEPPRQFVEGGEYYVLKVVPYVAKVGDVLEALEAGGTAAPLPK